MSNFDFSSPVSTLPHDTDGMFRFSGMFGSAYVNGIPQGDVVEVSGQVDVARIDVVVPGKAKTAHRRGREAREGTLTFQKIDSRWEKQMRNILGKTLAQRRADRDAGLFNLGMFDLMLKYDDPDALGVETMALYNCQVWQLPIGFNAADDIVQRQLPLTWEAEALITAFEASLTGSKPGAHYYRDTPLKR